MIYRKRQLNRRGQDGILSDRDRQEEPYTVRHQCQQGSGHQICKPEDGKEKDAWENGILFSMADSRIEIACRWGIRTCDGDAYGFSLAGKYIDFELSDGTVLACIMGASKGNESGSDLTGVVHHDDSIIEFLETKNQDSDVSRQDNNKDNADKEDILHGCDIVGAYVYSEKRLYDPTTDEYNTIFQMV